MKLLINKSLETAYVPPQIALAKVIPLHKEGDKKEFNNYRPIAIVSTIGKLLEKAVHSQLSGYLEESCHSNSISRNQFGFRSHHSIIHPLLLFSKKVHDTLTNGLHNLAIFIDLKKAFDTVNFDILLDKLHHYGISGMELKWFRNYLVRSQFVMAGGTSRSSILKMLCGIPQGTVLGPLLFIIFINDLPNATELFTLLFADDTTFQLEGDNVHNLIIRANLELLKAQEWFTSNKLTLNAKKTKLILFSPKGLKPQTLSPNLVLGGVDVERIGAGEKNKSVRFLGVWVDDELSFTSHLSKLKVNLSYGIHALQTSKFNTSLKIRLTIYHSLFASHLRFGSVMYGASSENSLLEIFKIQKRAIRLVSGSHYIAHTDPIFQRLGILKLSDIIDLDRQILVHKFRQGKLPSAFTKAFLIPVHPTDHARREDPLCYSLPPNHTRSPYTTLVKAWNSVPYDAKLMSSLDEFKVFLTSQALASYNSICVDVNCRSCLQ